MLVLSCATNAMPSGGQVTALARCLAGRAGLVVEDGAPTAVFRSGLARGVRLDWCHPGLPWALGAGVLPGVGWEGSPKP